MVNKRIVPVVIAVIKQQNKYLMTQRIVRDQEDRDFAPLAWNFPGGGLEFGEELEAGLKREIKEELNIEINIITQLPKIFTDIRQGWQGIFVCFLCEMKNNRDVIKLNEEAIEYGFFTIDEINKLKTLPKTKDIAQLAHQVNQSMT